MKKPLFLETAAIMFFLLIIPNCLSCTVITIPNCDQYDTFNSNTGNCGCLSCSRYAASGLSTACILCNTLFPYCGQCSTFSCFQCIQGYSKNSMGVCQDCAPIMTYCYYCNFAPPTCLGCYPGFFFNSSGKCDPCKLYLDNCSLCSSDTVCIQCDNYYGMNATNKCEPCNTIVSYCSQCNYTASCISCELGYQSLDGGLLCGVCEDVMPNCHVCNSSSQCQQCNQSTLGVNYTLIPNRCVPCNSYAVICIQCVYTSYCTKCINDSFALYLNSSSNQSCLHCDYFLVGCSTCLSSIACTSCINNNSFLYNSGNQNCEKCDYFIPNCLTCTPAHFCLSCLDKSYAASLGTCVLCLNFMNSCDQCNSTDQCIHCQTGKLVTDKSGCSTIVGCASVTTFSPINNNCIKCDITYFVEMPVAGKCQCISGWVVGSYCTTDHGCIGLMEANGNIVCVSCNVPLKYTLSNGKCVCIDHYSFNGTACVETCGDGFVIRHACDDGNTEDGDGCSHQCKVEANYQCVNDNNNYPASNCKFQSKVDLILVSIAKVKGENAAKITFKIVPFSVAITKMDLLSSVSFNAAGCQVKSVGVVGKQLVVEFGYSTDVTGQDGVVTMDFDREYVQSPQVNIRFKIVEESGVPLNYKEQSKSEEYYNQVMTGLSISSLLVFAFGSIAFKLIGVETLYTVQLMWFLLATSRYFKDFFIDFNSMNYGYGQLPLTTQGSVLTSRLGRLGFTTDMDDNYLFFSVINGVVLTVFAATHLYRLRLKYINQKLEEEKELQVEPDRKLIKQNARKIAKSDDFLRNFYNWAVFPIFVGFFLHFMHTFFANSTASVSDRTSAHYFFILFGTLITTSLIFHSEVLKFWWEDEKQILKDSQKSRYIPYFLVHNFIMFGLLTFTMFNNRQSINYCFGVVLVLAHLAYLIIRRPYESRVSNSAVIFNQMAILFSFFWVLSKDTPLDTATITFYLVFVYFGIVGIVNVLGLVRSVLTIKQTCARMALVQMQRLNERKKKRMIREEYQQTKQQIERRNMKNLIVDTSPRENRLSLQSPFLNQNRLQLNAIISGRSNQMYFDRAAL